MEFKLELPYYEELTTELVQYYELILKNNRFLLKRNIIFVLINSQTMIQRIQSVYLFVVFIIMGIISLFTPLWTNGLGDKIFVGNTPSTAILFGASAALSIIAMLGYKNRKRQFVMNRLNIILNFILVGLFVYRTLMISGETAEAISEKGIGMFLPIVSILLLVLANRAIKKDEDLVKSVDRLR